MMSCPEHLERIGAYLDGALSGAELEAFRKHIGECTSCREELALQERMWGVLGEFKTVSGGEALRQRILEATVRARTTGSRRRSRLWWTAPLAAAAVVLIAVMLWHGEKTSGPKVLDAETIAVIEKLDVLEHLEVLENLDLLQEAVKEPILIEDPETAGTVFAEGSS